MKAKQGNKQPRNRSGQFMWSGKPATSSNNENDDLRLCDTGASPSARPDDFARFRQEFVAFIPRSDP